MSAEITEEKAEEVVFNQELNDLMVKHVEIFKFEYDNVSDSTWSDFKNKPRCKCRKEVFTEIQKDPDKFNRIISKLRGRETIVYFPGPLKETIVKEFEDLKTMEEFLNDLKRKGTIIRSATPSPNGKGGFLLIVL